eukprot:Lithocolla_globosa_v1_NODE_5469_length_1234_cov_47.785411.p1 type:complete len:200 gc:universal NODE_5469_length_1234_cov_47.785411:332-931(+)
MLVVWSFSGFYNIINLPFCLLKQGKGLQVMHTDGRRPDDLNRWDIPKALSMTPLTEIKIRDIDSFVAGNLADPKFTENWKFALKNQENREEVLEYINGVDARKYFKPFRGIFKGKHYNFSTPPRMQFKNAKNAETDFHDWVSEEIRKGVKVRTIKVWGKENECDPPHLVLPITVEPTKPRMCWNGQFGLSEFGNEKPTL